MREDNPDNIFQLIFRCVITAALLLLSACTMVGPDFEKPELDISEDWTDAQDAQINTDGTESKTWWLVFEDPVLTELVSMAYRQNLTLQIAGLQVLEARAELGIATGNLYPQSQQVIGGATYFDNSKNSPGSGIPGADLDFTNYDLGFDATWELDVWGKYRRGIQSADASFLASVADYDDILVTLTAEVARVYVILRTLEERLRISHENVEIQKESVRIAEARYKFGETTELDTMQAQSLLYSTLTSVPALEAEITQAKNALAVLLGIEPSEVGAIIGGDGKIPVAPKMVTVGIPAELLRRRPDIRRAELDAAAQSNLIGVAKSDLYPSFALFGTIGLAASTSNDAASDNLFESDSVFFQGGPSLNWNVFNYGRITNEVRVQDARFQQLLVSYEDTVLRALQEAEDSMSAFIDSQDEIEFLTKGVSASKRAVDIALLQYQEGAADYTRVLDTQESLFRDQDRLVDARGASSNNLVSLYKALGGGWQIRVGDEFVPISTQEQMRERTNWGHLLETRNTLTNRTDEGKAGRDSVAW